MFFPRDSPWIGSVKHYFKQRERETAYLDLKKTKELYCRFENGHIMRYLDLSDMQNTRCAIIYIDTFARIKQYTPSLPHAMQIHIDRFHFSPKCYSLSDITIQVKAY